MIIPALIIVLCLFCPPGLLTAATDSLPTIAAKTKSMKRLEGFFTIYQDEKNGKLWLEVERLNEEFLYLNALSAGVGSNDIGLDRGQLGGSRVVFFERAGPKLLLTQPNYSYRAESDNEAEKRSVREAFAQSILWGFSIAAETQGRVLVDATGFFLRDAHGVADRLKDAKEGSYSLDAARSALFAPGVKNFPENTIAEATLTFKGKPAGKHLSTVTPTPEALTVRQRHSFVKLPDSGYRPRAFDPRAGFFSLSFADYATPVEEPLRKRYILRHRLKKKNPGAARSEAQEPIVYYLDPGAPEPVRSALLDGARWWSAAFDAAGFIKAFRVEMLPEGADMMDVRYNVIQWVHRSTRGWSYGASVIDPRTGEILKGHVSLGSLRFRQDFLIAEGLLAPYETGTQATPAMRAMALARLRQLSAHEIGHTLGLAHNFAASADGRASVMDYPHPLVQLNAAGEIGLDSAYAEGLGAWDIAALRYGYTEFATAEAERAGLAALVNERLEAGLHFISDRDARPRGGAHPAAHLWDNGADAATELQRMLKVRARALEEFSERVIPAGRPLASLSERLTPIFLLHRYQTEACAKLLGGLRYAYTLRGDGQPAPAIVEAQLQHKALDALLATLNPETLTLSDRILDLIPPQPHGYWDGREHFKGHTGLTFDPVAAAASAADMTLRLILNSQRASRLVQYKARNPACPGLDETLNRLLAITWKAPRKSGLAAETQRAVESAALARMMKLASSANASNQARALAWAALENLVHYLELNAPLLSDSKTAAHFRFARAQIRAFLERPTQEVPLTPAPAAPPGSPIGCGH